MKRKRKHNKHEARETEQEENIVVNNEEEKVKPAEDEHEVEEPVEEVIVEEDQEKEEEEVKPASGEQMKVKQPKHDNSEYKQKKFKPAYARVSVDPTRQYRTPESRESWGPNVKGKKFRKEKGKKKRCPNAGCRIDGAVKSVRLDV